MIKWFGGRAMLLGLGVTAAVTLGIILNTNPASDHRTETERDRKSKIEQLSSTAAAKTIIPALNRYADMVEGKAKHSVADRSKMAKELRRSAGLAKAQGTKLDSLNLIYKTGVCWDELAGHLIIDAEIVEGTVHLMDPYLHSSVQLNRKIAAVLQKHADQGFVNSAYLGSDLDEGGDYFREHIVGNGSSYTSATGSHTDFIKETSDLPSSAQYALDSIYKANPARAWELSRQAHEAGVQELPNQ